MDKSHRFFWITRLLLLSTVPLLSSAFSLFPKTTRVASHSSERATGLTSSKACTSNKACTPRNGIHPSTHNNKLSLASTATLCWFNGDNNDDSLTARQFYGLQNTMSSSGALWEPAAVVKSLIGLMFGSSILWTLAGCGGPMADMMYLDSLSHEVPFLRVVIDSSAADTIPWCSPSELVAILRIINTVVPLSLSDVLKSQLTGATLRLASVIASIVMESSSSDAISAVAEAQEENLSHDGLRMDDEDDKLIHPQHHATIAQAVGIFKSLAYGDLLDLVNNGPLDRNGGASYLTNLQAVGLGALATVSALVYGDLLQTVVGDDDSNVQSTTSSSVRGNALSFRASLALYTRRATSAGAISGISYAASQHINSAVSVLMASVASLLPAANNLAAVVLGSTTSVVGL